MTLLPNSLAARTVLLVVAVVAVAELATFSLILNQGRQSHKHQTVDFVSGQIRLLQTVLPGLNSEARRHLASADVGEQGVQLRPDSSAVPQREPDFNFARALSTELNRNLDTPVVLRHAGLGRPSNLWIGFMAGNERWWLLLPPPRFSPRALPPDLWQWLAASLAVLVFVAVLFVRGIVGPLARLGEAVTATGDGSARTVIPEGPKEVQRLAERHNTMLAQLASAQSERQEMLAGLTHDLRAPLARLRVRLALLENEAERIGLSRDADDMERIVGQCLDFLRSEVNVRPPASPILISEAVSDEVARQCELGRPLQMRVSAEAAACRVLVSRGNLQRMLDNLIDNALRYGAPPVEISLSLKTPQSLALCVRDHGSGIAESQRARALEAFSQIEPARATGGSCGLGLAIVQRIAQSCSAYVALEEAGGGGLAVVVTFPVV